MCSCRQDPALALVPVLTAMPAAGILLGDVTADSGYAHRDAGAWAVPLRRAGAYLLQDLHPHDRAPAAPTGACTAPPRQSRFWNSGPCCAAPRPVTWPATTSRQPNSPGTSSAGSPPTSLATTASPAWLRWARSAAPSGRSQ